MDLVNEEYVGDYKEILISLNQKKYKSNMNPDPDERIVEIKKIKLNLYKNFKGLYFSMHYYKDYVFDSENKVIDL